MPLAVDFLHHGHIRIIKKASKYGPVIIGLMTGSGLKSYKGQPALNFRQRKEIISQIKNVDYIIPLEGLIYCQIAEKLKVDFFIHGSDWKKGPQKKERQKLINLIKKWRGKVIDIPYTKSISSTKIKKFVFFKKSN